ncbi:MAG: peptidoglycan-associated lipoprotein Pal [Bacteroidales bacterium]
MNKDAWMAISLVMILPVMFFTVSCTKEVVQSHPVSANDLEVQNASEKSVEKAEQAGQLQEDRLRAEAAKQEFVSESIHFALDSSLLSDQAQALLNSKAYYLRTNQDIMVTIEGHCDDRGTNAYNIALGERRAESVKSFFVDLGINANRMNTISYGEERPFAMGQNEVSWAKNRRAQFVLN